MKRKKFDIQFTFNRLPVQMEHRACDRITRTEMRHVLFPREDVIHQRAEMNKHVGSVHSHKKIKENFVTFPVKSFLINFKKISAVVSLTILCFHTKLWRSLNSKKRGREVRGGGVREASTLRLPSASPPPPVLHTHGRFQIACPLNRPLWRRGWEGADVVSNCTMGLFWGTISSFIGCYESAQETGSQSHSAIQHNI